MGKAQEDEFPEEFILTKGFKRGHTVFKKGDKLRRYRANISSVLKKGALLYYRKGSDFALMDFTLGAIQEATS